MLRFAAILTLAVAACSKEVSSSPTGTARAHAGPASVPARAQPPRPSNPAVGGRPDPALAADQDPALRQANVQPLLRSDFEHRIESGLGCSFESATGQTLVVATAPMDPAAHAAGVVKVAGKVQLLRAVEPGGYQALASGQSLTNETGWSAFVRRAAGRGRAEGTEVSSWPASLIVAMEDGGSVTFEDGYWSCGA